MAQENSIEGGI